MVTFDDSDSVIELVARDGVPGLAMGGPLTPDQIVYCGSFPLWLELKRDESSADLLARIAVAGEKCISDIRGGLHQGTPRTTDCGAGPKPGNVHLRAHVGGREHGTSGVSRRHQGDDRGAAAGRRQLFARRLPRVYRALGSRVLSSCRVGHISASWACRRQGRARDRGGPGFWFGDRPGPGCSGRARGAV